MAGGPPRAAADAGPQDRRADRLPVRRSAPAASPSTTSTTTIIPMLCRKAGVPHADVRGQHHQSPRPSTIASQLYNAKEPMTLFELQAWLGHRALGNHPALRQDHPEHADQGLHRRRLLRTQRPHHRSPHRPRRRHLRSRRQRPALAALRPRSRLLQLHLLRAVPAPNGLRQVRLLHPKDSSKALLLEAKDNLQRMLAAIPLTDDERAAVDDGQAALDQLLRRLADVPTPAGPTPREIRAPATATVLPIVDVRQGPPQTTTA